MAYLGKQPVRGQNRELDDISGSFNGSTTAFTMQVGGVNTSAGSVNQIFINVGGILQNPGTDFTVAASTLTFTTAPASGLDFWGLIQGDAVDINEPADGSVTEAKLNANAPTNDHVLTADATTSGGFKWAAASGTTINTNADNRVITGSGTANTLNGEANLTYDGNNVNLETDADGEGIVIHAAGNTYNQITLDANRSAATNPVGAIFGKWNGNTIGSMQFNAGTDTTNKDDGYFDLRTAEGGTNTERLRIGQDGKWYKNTKQILLPLQFYQVNVTGSTNFNTTTSWPDTKTLVTNFSPVKGGSRLWISWQVQTYWPSTSASAATDVYARIMATNTSAGAGYNEVWKNSRWAGNFSGTGNTRLQSYKLSLFTCVTASDGADMDFKLQAFMGSTLSDDFNICHTDEYNYFSIWEYDIT